MTEIVNHYMLYVHLTLMKEELRDLGEFGLMNLVGDRLSALKNSLTATQLSEAADEIGLILGKAA